MLRLLDCFYAAKAGGARGPLSRALAEVLRDLQRTTSRFGRGQQADPHELFLELANSFPKAWKALFAGRIAAEVACPARHSLRLEEPFLALSLDVPGGPGRRRKADPVRLNKLLKRFEQRSEPISGFRCAVCAGPPGRASRRNSFRRLPQVLALHFKLFDAGARKKNVRVDFEETLRLAGVRYEVAGVVEHRGRGLGFGHYVSFCRRSDGAWVCLNDARVAPVSRREVLGRARPYMLFYRKAPAQGPRVKPDSRGSKASPEGPRGAVSQKRGPSAGASIEDIFSGKALRGAAEEGPPASGKAEARGGGLLDSLRLLAQSQECRSYLAGFAETNAALLRAKEDLRRPSFCHNGRVFRVEDLLRSAPKAPAPVLGKRSGFVGLSKKFGRLRRMARASGLLREAARGQQAPAAARVGGAGRVERGDVAQYLLQVETAAAGDLWTQRARKASLDAAYDRGKRRKVRRKPRVKGKKKDFHAAFLRKSGAAN